MNWKIKKFNELNTKEIYKILGLRNEVFIVEQECTYQDCDEKDFKSYHLFAEEDNQIVAYLRILEKGVSYDEISIGRVIVKESHRGRGISKNMLLKAIDFIESDLSEKTIKIQAQARLTNLYKSVGFKETSKEYLLGNIPHIDMLYNKR